MIAMPRVVLATLDTAVLLLALRSKPASQRAIVERTAAWARVLEGRDLLPFLGWHSFIASRLLAILARLSLQNGLGFLELSFLAGPSRLVLLSLG